MSKEQEIRTNVLKVLYDFAKNNPGCMMDRSEVKSKVGIEDDKILDFNMFYLEDKGFVELTKFIGVAWAFVQITSAVPLRKDLPVNWRLNPLPRTLDQPEFCRPEAQSFIGGAKNLAEQIR